MLLCGHAEEKSARHLREPQNRLPVSASTIDTLTTARDEAEMHARLTGCAGTRPNQCRCKVQEIPHGCLAGAS